HHVLLGPEPHVFEAADGQCAATAASLLDAAIEQAAVKRFNKVLRRLDGCKTLDSLRPKVFADAPAAFDTLRKHAAEQSFKQVHTITRIPLPGDQCQPPGVCYHSGDCMHSGPLIMTIKRMRPALLVAASAMLVLTGCQNL